MDIEALASLESQKRFCHEIVQNVIDHESFILLSGDSGSGRTVICEQIVNETDSKMRAIFIPCHKDMQLQRLRELFLQQLIPNSSFDTDLNLPDALLKAHIPYNHKILVVVDDVDSVVSAFYNELVALHEQFLGQARFAFVLVCHPLWAEEKLSHYTGKADISAMQMPALTIKEAMVLSRHMFALQNTMRIYNAISNKLPEALASAKGNISQIIAITEKLMKDPTAPQVSNEKVRKNGKVSMPKSGKKSGSVGIFVTIVCIIIVLACLIPIFLGSSFFSSEDTNKTSSVQSQVANEDALVFDKGSQDFNKDFAMDDGLLPQNVPNGIDAQTSAPQTEHSVTLSGKELEKIEGGANGSAYPRGMGGSLNANQQQIPVLRRGDNFNHVNKNNNQATTAIDVPTEHTLIAAPAVPPVDQNQVLANKLKESANELDKLAQAQAQALAQSHSKAPAPAPAPQVSAKDRTALEQAAINKINQDREQARKNALQSEQNAKQTAANKQDKAPVKKEEAVKAPAVAPTPARQPLKAGQVISLAEEQRQAKAAAAAAAAAAQAQTQAQAHPQAAGNGFEADIAQLKALSNDRFTIQIVSGSNRANVSAAARGLTGRYWIVPSVRNGKPWYILMAGDYASREEASAAARNIPRSVSQGATPFAKRVADAKAEIRQ